MASSTPFFFCEVGNGDGFEQSKVGSLISELSKIQLEKTLMMTPMQWPQSDLFGRSSSIFHIG